MKLQPASQKEVKRMAIGCSLCMVAEILGFLLLSLFGIGKFSYQILTGALGGTLVAVGNFALMCIMVQKATGTKDEKLLRAKVQASYNFRLFIQAAWVVIAFILPFINIIAAAIPLLFPTAVIYYLQMTGKLLPPSSNTSPSRNTDLLEESDESEDNLNSFEV